MRRLIKIATVILLLTTVCYGGFAQNVFTSNILGLGITEKGGGNSLQEGGKDINPISMAGKIRGVIFHGTAVPSGNAVGQKVAMQYDPAQPDGWRLSITIGNTAVMSGLYDWEIIPVAQFVQSGNTALMTLYDSPQTDEEKETHKRYFSKGIMWANFHPALSNTLIGLNLFFADAMLVNLDLMQFADEAFTDTIPGYHITGRNFLNMSRDRRIENTAGIALLLNIEGLYGNWNSYIYTDYGTEISYRIENRQIVFSGVPSYLFVYIRGSGKSETITVATEMNEQFRSLYINIYAINPTVYRTAERTAQWAAFFRMVQSEYPEVWQRFISQIADIEAVPKVTTPRYWLSFTERE